MTHGQFWSVKVTPKVKFIYFLPRRLLPSPTENDNHTWQCPPQEGYGNRQRTPNSPSWTSAVQAGPQKHEEGWLFSGEMRTAEKAREEVREMLERQSIEGGGPGSRSSEKKQNWRRWTGTPSQRSTCTLPSKREKFEHSQILKSTSHEWGAEMHLLRGYSGIFILCAAWKATLKRKSKCPNDWGMRSGGKEFGSWVYGVPLEIEQRAIKPYKEWPPQDHYKPPDMNMWTHLL